MGKLSRWCREIGGATLGGIAPPAGRPARLFFSRLRLPPGAGTRVGLASWLRLGMPSSPPEIAPIRRTAVLGAGPHHPNTHRKPLLLQLSGVLLLQLEDARLSRFLLGFYPMVN